MSAEKSPEPEWACARCALRLPDSKIPKRVRGVDGVFPAIETDQAGFHDRRFRWLDTKHGFVVFHDEQWKPTAPTPGPITIGPLCGPLYRVAEYDALAGLDDWDVLRGIVRTGLLRSMEPDAVERVMGKLERRLAVVSKWDAAAALARLRSLSDTRGDTREWMCGACLCLYRAHDDLPPTAEGCGVRYGAAPQTYVHSCPVSLNPDQPLAPVAGDIVRCGASNIVGRICRRPAGHTLAVGHRAMALHDAGAFLTEWQDGESLRPSTYQSAQPAVVWVARRLPRPAATYQHARQRAHAFRSSDGYGAAALCGVERPRRVERASNIDSIPRCRTCERLSPEPPRSGDQHPEE